MINSDAKESQFEAAVRTAKICKPSSTGNCLFSEFLIYPVEDVIVKMFILMS